MTDRLAPATCAEVEDAMSEILDGSAPERLFEHLADCDVCRDARHEASEVVERLQDAGGDFMLPADLSARLDAALSQEIAPSVQKPREDSSVAETPASSKRPERQQDPEQSSTEPQQKKDAEVEPPAAQPSRQAAKVADLRARLAKWVTPGRAIAAAVAAAAGAMIWYGSSRGEDSAAQAATEPWRGKVAHVSPAASTAGFERCDPAGQSCTKIGSGTMIPAGSVLKTDERTRATLGLDDGSEVTLDRDTILVLSSAAPRRAELKQGAIVADIAHHDARARFDMPRGYLEVLGTKFSLRAGERFASVDVLRGSVRLADRAGRDVTVRAGEAGRIEGSSAPQVEAAPALAESLAWTETLEGKDSEEQAPRGLGELRAKRPGSDRELDAAVVLTSHRVNVRISGVMARTEVEEVFTNKTDQVLEGIYRFPLPPDAKIERLALEVDGKLEEGAFLDRDRAAKIWRGAIVNSTPKNLRQPREEIVWVPGPWRDPALLEWQRGGRFELRIYPIPKQGSRRVVLAYTQAVRPVAGVRRYSYPLAHDPGGSTKVADFALDLQVRGHDRNFGVRGSGYELVRGAQGEAETLRMAERDFSPSGDLMIEYALPHRDREVEAFAFRDAGDKPDLQATYLALALRPKLPRAAEQGERGFAIIVDASRSMYGESYKRAVTLAARAARELDPLDRLTVLACDVQCRRMPGGMQHPGVETARAVEQFLDDVVPAGASDVAEAVRQAQLALRDGSLSRGRIVYIGDGTPTVGSIRPALLAREVRELVRDANTSVTAVAVGADSDLDSLSVLAHAGGGTLLPYAPGQTSAETTYALLAATYGTALRDVEVVLPEGMSEVAPKQIGTLMAGDERFIVARTDSDKVSGTVVLKGKLGGKSFEQRYPLELSASRARGNAFVPRLFAAYRIADLERETVVEAKTRAIELSQRFNVASRYTSLLVLESAAMFKAFGLDNTRRAPEWTGEEELESVGADGEDALDVYDDADRGKDASMNLGFGGAVAKPKRAATAPAEEFRRAEGAGTSLRRSAPSPAPAPSAPSTTSTFDAKKAREATSRPPATASPPPPVVLQQDQAFVQQQRRMIPMRRIWERTGDVITDRLIPKAASASDIARVEFKLRENENSRDALVELYTLYTLAGRISEARGLVDRWIAKEPLSSEALTAEADLEARAGRRDRAIRILGSVIDMRPDDVKAQMRLSRLHRWAGARDLACRFSLAAAQLRSGDAERIAEAVRCLRGSGTAGLADDVLASADDKTRDKVAKLLTAPAPDDFALSGDVRLEATWQGVDHDLDLALISSEGHRISWLGAPTKAVISARDVTSASRESLALRGAKPGEYVVEVVRARGSGPVSGNVTVSIAGQRRSVPFAFDGERATLALANVRMVPRLVPIAGWR